MDADDMREMHGTEPGDAAEAADGGGNEAAGYGGGASVPPALRPTRPQLVAWSIASVLALVIGILYSAYRVNLGLGARDVGGAVMPPGMVMTRDTPGEAMREMAAVDPDAVDYAAPADARGGQPLEPRLAGEAKVFNLELSVIEWNILPDEQVTAYAFNEQVPGPTIRLTVGDRVRINVKNDLPEETSVHWHGLILPNEMDGPAYITQPPIQPGETYTYEYTVVQAGTFFYHSHLEPDRQQALGMYGALIIDSARGNEADEWDLEYTIQLQEWLEREGYTYPAMLMEGALPNFFTINGKSYPATETIRMERGERVLLRFIGSSNNFIHPMHVHGGPFTVIATDGNSVPADDRVQKDTINVAPGERYDVVWTAREPGRWLLHCHIPHHTTNNNVEEAGGGGLTTIIEVSP
jgi:FtsP/CotA-like multicopper oxidase with cupredoxin domain